MYTGIMMALKDAAGVLIKFANLYANIMSKNNSELEINKYICYWMGKLKYAIKKEDVMLERLMKSIFWVLKSEKNIFGWICGWI